MANEARPAADPLIDSALVTRLIASQFPHWAAAMQAQIADNLS